MLTKNINYFIDSQYYPLLETLTKESKLVYNKTLFCYKLFKKFEVEILSSETPDLEFQRLYHEYSSDYTQINRDKELLYVKLKDVLITNTNYEDVKNSLCLEFNKVAIDDILESLYNKYYYRSLHELITHKPLTYPEFHEIVKNKDHYLYKNKNEILTQLRKEKKLKESFFIENNFIEMFEHFRLNSNVIRSIVSKQFNALVSFYKLQEKGYKASKPKYKQENEKHLLIYRTNTFKQENNQVRLSLHKDIQNSINEKFLYFKIPKKFHNKKIHYIEIVPTLQRFKICMTYKEEPKIQETRNTKITSVDLGLKNHYTCYTPGDKCKIIKMSKLNHINSKYNRLIDKFQQANPNDFHLNQEYYNLWIQRNFKMNGAINKFVEDFIKEFHDTKTFIFGYNESWKTNINLGTRTNRKFYQLPFKKIINKLRSKLETLGCSIIEVEESYTSKCSALDLEPLRKKNNYLGQRVHRGLYKSKKGLLNADVNGAINIFRKKYKEHKIDRTHIFNPIIIKI